MGDIHCSQFNHPYASLNGTRSISALRKDIKRALITVGYPSGKSARAEVGVWRAKMLCNMVQGYLTSDLKTTDYFGNLEASEKTTVSFLFAQAFSLWFAQEFLNMYYLVHVNSHRDRDNRTKYEKTWSQSPKGGASTPKGKSRPDFIGRCPQGYHVFESKGRSSGSFVKIMPSALAQVSRINLINGSAPLTRVACCFSFLSSGVEGFIQDPEKEKTAFNLTFDESQALRKVYAPFLSKDFRENKRNDIVDGFLCLKIDEDVTIGIDEELYRYELDRYPHWPGLFYPEPLWSFEKRRQSLKEDKRLSIGRDGIILLDKSSID